MNPDHPVIKLCVAGMEAEGRGDGAAARALFEEAWRDATDDYHAAVAAHYLARHQSTADAALEWNQTALDRALSAGEAVAGGFLPSLYLNLGHSHELVGDRGRAADLFRAAQAHVHRLPDGPYGDLVRDGLRRAIDRISNPSGHRTPGAQPSTE